jgi:hypothetical protein
MGRVTARTKRFAISLLLAFHIVSANAQQNLFVSGKVIWHTGTPAHGFEVQLVCNNQVVSAAFTDSDGDFAFFDVNGTPSSCRILVLSARGVISEMQISNVPRGGTMPLITIR